MVYYTSSGVSLWCRRMHGDLFASLFIQSGVTPCDVLQWSLSTSFSYGRAHNVFLNAIVCTVHNYHWHLNAFSSWQRQSAACILPYSFCKATDTWTAEGALQGCALLGHFAWPQKPKVILMCHTAPGGQEMQILNTQRALYVCAFMTYTSTPVIFKQHKLCIYTILMVCVKKVIRQSHSSFCSTFTELVFIFSSLYIVWSNGVSFVWQVHM